MTMDNHAARKAAFRQNHIQKIFRDFLLSISVMYRLIML